MCRLGKSHTTTNNKRPSHGRPRQFAGCSKLPLNHQNTRSQWRPVQTASSHKPASSSFVGQQCSQTSPFGHHRRHKSTLKAFPLGPPLSVPDHIPKPPYYRLGAQYPAPSQIGMIEHKSDLEIDRMRKACALAGYVREYVGKFVKPGVTTAELDKIVHNEIIRHDAYPSPFNYSGFPRSVCSSINEVICHGIPDTRPLENGDIVKLDVSVFVDGFHGDCCGTFAAGDVDEKGLALMETTRRCLDEAINICRVGLPLSKIGDTISDIAEAQKYGVVQEYTGHGIGRDFHVPPPIFHGRNGYPGQLIAGMTFTIEPMIVEGSPITSKWVDGWTVVTVDGSRAAQYEETIAIDNNGDTHVLTDSSHYLTHWSEYAQRSQPDD